MDNQIRQRFMELYGRTEEERAACAAYGKQWWPGETAHRIRIADELLRQEFLFDLPWDMEQTAEMVKFDGEIDWLYQPGDDPEFIFQMNRHRYWVCLGQAYAMTGNEAYAACFVHQLTDWIEKNPITEETKGKSWRTIEAGLRAESWIKAMSYFADSPHVTDAVFAQFLDCLTLHAKYLADSDRPFATKSNWGVLENSGLYAIGKLLETTAGRADGTEFAALALTRLTRQIQVQVMDDGVHWEQSPMYHNEVLKCYLEVLRTADRFGETLPAAMTDRVRAMAMADRIWQKPDGSQPSGGDSDVTDLRDVLTIAAYQFRDPVLRSGGYERMDYEGIWDYGMGAQTVYEAIPARNPDSVWHLLGDSGNGYLRSSWGTDADYLHVRCGSLGGGHGHFDKLHLDLVIGGEDVFIDPGRYTYVDGPMRRKLKSALAHNGVTVDGAEYTECLDSWKVKGLFPAVRGNSCQKGDYTLFECGHTGYISRGVYVERRVAAIGTRIYLVMDTCYGAGPHSCEQHFHLAPQLTAEVRSGDAGSGSGNGFTLTGNGCRVDVIPVSAGAAASVETFEYSEHYNQLKTGQMLTFSRAGEDVVTMVTAVICRDLPEMVTAGTAGGQRMPEKPVTSVTAAACRPELPGMQELSARRLPVEAPTSGRVLSDGEAEAVEICAGGRTWVVVNAHVEQGCDCEYIGAAGCFGLGRVMIGAMTEQGMETTVLRW